MSDVEAAAGRARAGGTYRRSAGSPRGEARRRHLLDRVADDLAVNGLVDFSLRRAAKAAGTTHKVLLYYFADVDDLLAQAIVALRDRRIERGLTAAEVAAVAGRGRLSDRVRAFWPILISEEARVLDQAIGLVMYDPQRYARLGQQASQQYLQPLTSILPERWSPQRRLQVAEMILATLRGLLVARHTGAPPNAIEAGFDALVRALDREETAES